MYNKIQTGDLSNKTLQTIRDSIRKNGNQYILDVDLDYFVCNGKPLDKQKYSKEPYDIHSHHRIEQVKFNQNIPRDTGSLSTAFSRYSKQLHKEVVLINDRIRTFFKIIKYLKKHGLLPSHISICDSTNIQFEDCNTCNSISNGYVPTHLAFYVHTKIVSGLQTILH
jgi:hypothetical protein